MPSKENMRIFRWLSLVAVLSGACGGSSLELNNFDEKKWQEDRFACNGLRAGLSEVVLRQRDQILAHGEMEIVEILGKPDESELYKRNQKFYYYYVEPGPRCDNGNKEAKKLVIRFNAVGLAKEILIE